MQKEIWVVEPLDKILTEHYNVTPLSETLSATKQLPEVIANVRIKYYTKDRTPSLDPLSLRHTIQTKQVLKGDEAFKDKI